MATWTIKGETGKRWDNSTLTFGERGICNNGKFNFNYLNDDTFTFEVKKKESFDSADFPELGQVVAVYRDGVSFFHGIVTDINPNYPDASCKIVVSGPWWFMEQIPLTGARTDDVGVTKDRMVFVFGTETTGQQMKTSIEGLINRMIALGCPIQLGTVATFHEYPRITFAEMSCGSAFSELLRLCPDAVAWFDYSTVPATLNVTRRPVMSTTSFAIGSSEVSEVDLSPRLDLQVKKVVLPYAEKTIAGVTEFAETTSTGTAGPGTSDPDKIMVFPISGPEINDFLPFDELDFVEVKFLTRSSIDFLKRFVRPVGKFIKDHGTALCPFQVNGLYSIPPAIYDTNHDGIDKWVSPTKLEGISFSTGHTNVVTFGTDEYDDERPPKWVLKENTFTEGVVNGTVHSESAKVGYLPIDLSSKTGMDWLDTFSSVHWTCKNGSTLGGFLTSESKIVVHTVSGTANSGNLHQTGTLRTISPNTSPNTQAKLATSASSQAGYYIGSTLRFKATDGKYYSVTVTDYDEVNKICTFASVGKEPDAGESYFFDYIRIYKAADFSYIKPPAGFAEYLLECQNFIIYEGTVDITQEEIGATRYLGKAINLTNGLTEHATMKTMVVGETLFFGSGVTEIRTGCAMRHSMSSVIKKIRKQPQDNTYYIQ